MSYRPVQGSNIQDTSLGESKIYECDGWSEAPAVVRRHGQELALQGCDRIVCARPPGRRSGLRILDRRSHRHPVAGPIASTCRNNKNGIGTVSVQENQARADIYGSRARIGYTSPPLTTEIFPYEFYKIVPAGVTLVVTSLAIVVRSKDEVDQSYDISMRAAREMAAAGCDIVVLGGVPINLSRGAANAGADHPRPRKRTEGQSLDQRRRRRPPPRSALGCKKVVVGAALRKDRDRPDRELCPAFRLRGAGRDRLGLGLQPDRAYPAPCSDRDGARADA